MCVALDAERKHTKPKSADSDGASECPSVRTSVRPHKEVAGHDAVCTDEGVKRDHEHEYEVDEAEKSRVRVREEENNTQSKVSV